METSSEATSKTVGLYSPVIGCTSACIPAHLLRQTSRCFTDNSNEPRSSPPTAIRYQSVSCRLHSKYISVSASLHLKTKWNETLENELVPKRIRRCSVRYYKTPSEKSCVKRRGARANTHLLLLASVTCKWRNQLMWFRLLLVMEEDTKENRMCFAVTWKFVVAKKKIKIKGGNRTRARKKQRNFLNLSMQRTCLSYRRYLNNSRWNIKWEMGWPTPL